MVPLVSPATISLNKFIRLPGGHPIDSGARWLLGAYRIGSTLEKGRGILDTPKEKVHMYMRIWKYLIE